MGGGGWYWGRGRGRLYTYRYTVTTKMTSALMWAAMRAILMFHNCERQSQKKVSMDHSFWRERRAEADSNRGPSTYQPNALPLGQTSSLYHSAFWCNSFYMLMPKTNRKRLKDFNFPLYWWSFSSDAVSMAMKVKRGVFLISGFKLFSKHTNTLNKSHSFPPM